MPATFALYARDQFSEPYQMADLASQITRLMLWPPRTGAIVESSSAPGYAKVKIWLVPQHLGHPTTDATSIGPRRHAAALMPAAAVCRAGWPTPAPTTFTWT